MNSYQRRRRWRSLRFGLKRVAKAAGNVAISTKALADQFERFSTALKLLARAA